MISFTLNVVRCTNKILQKLIHAALETDVTMTCVCCSRLLALKMLNNSQLSVQIPSVIIFLFCTSLLHLLNNALCTLKLLLHYSFRRGKKKWGCWEGCVWECCARLAENTMIGARVSSYLLSAFFPVKVTWTTCGAWLRIACLAQLHLSLCSWAGTLHCSVVWLSANENMAGLLCGTKKSRSKGKTTIPAYSMLVLQCLDMKYQTEKAVVALDGSKTLVRVKLYLVPSSRGKPRLRRHTHFIRCCR